MSIKALEEIQDKMCCERTIVDVMLMVFDNNVDDNNGELLGELMVT